MKFNTMTIHELREIARRWHILDGQCMNRKQLVARLIEVANEDPNDLSSNRNRL